jgi:3-oxoacyl-[acyl-carrier protein] reductase
VSAEKMASAELTSMTERFQPNITPVAGRLKGKAALITGSGRGIGRAMAIRFAQEGAGIIVLDKDGEPAHETAEEVRRLGPQALAFKTDVTDRQAIEKTLKEALD